MCDCEYCKRVADIYSTIRRYEYAVSTINRLESDFTTVSNNLERLGSGLESYMNTACIEELKAVLNALDDDMTSTKDAISGQINGMITNLYNEKAIEEANAANFHAEEEKRRLRELGLLVD